MYECDACGEAFETLSQLRLEHEPCPVAEARRRRETAIERLQEDRGLAIGDRCRIIQSGAEAEIVDVEAGGEDEAPRVVWIPADVEDDPERRRTATFDEVV